MIKTICLSALLGLMTQAALCAEVSINISGVASEEGSIGCLIFNKAEGFPKDVDKALDKLSQPGKGNAICAFTGLSSGTYAIAVNHDKNDNQMLDTNLLGMPKEPWGVSNNIRPSFRPPTFEEAQFELNDEQTLTLEIEVKK